MNAPASGRYTPTSLHEIVREVRAGQACTAAVCTEHGFSAAEWLELNRRFDTGEMRLTRLQVLRRAA